MIYSIKLLCLSFWAFIEMIYEVELKDYRLSTVNLVSWYQYVYFEEKRPCSWRVPRLPFSPPWMNSWMESSQNFSRKVIKINIIFNEANIVIFTKNNSLYPPHDVHIIQDLSEVRFLVYNNIIASVLWKGLLPLYSFLEIVNLSVNL